MDKNVKFRRQQEVKKNIVIRISMKKIESKTMGKTKDNCDQLKASSQDSNNNSSSTVPLTKAAKKDSSFATSVKNLFNKSSSSSSSSSSHGDKNNNPAPATTSQTLNLQGYTKVSVDTATTLNLAAAANKFGLNQIDEDQMKSLTANIHNLGISEEQSKSRLSDDFSPENCCHSSQSFDLSKEMEKSRQNQKQLGQANIIHTSDGDIKYHSKDYYEHFLVPDLEKITSCCYYWGKMDRYEAEKLLENKPEGTFLLRDSAQDDYLFSVSFRKYGRSLHARIEQDKQKFSFDSHDPTVFTANTVTDLVEHYKDPSSVMFFEPMLTSPLNRNYVFGLQQLTRAAIVSRTSYDGIDGLCLPAQLKSYLREYHYKKKIIVRPDPAHISHSS